jgi:hypothetical protein
MRDLIDTSVPGGLPAVVEAIDDRDLAGFLQQRFFAGNWYDFLPILPLTGVVAAVMKAPLKEAMRLALGRQADRDVRGIHRLLLLLTSPEVALTRLVLAHSRYFEFGSAEISSMGRGYARTRINGVPLPLAGWHRMSSTAFVDRVLQLAGARMTHVTWDPDEPDGERAGVPLVRMSAHRTWTV